MTDKIKSARETVNIFKDALKKRDYETILEALSTYERLQGVDLDGMRKTPYTPDEMAADYFDPLEDRYSNGWNDSAETFAEKLTSALKDKGV